MRHIFTVVIFVVLAIGFSNAHVNIYHSDIVSASEYVFGEFQIGHAKDGYYTSKVEIIIPPGIQGARPEVESGWDITINTRPLPPDEQYLDHGVIVNETVGSIIYSASHPVHSLHDDHVQRFGISFKFGCKFNDVNSHSVWNGKYTVWFKTIQYLSLYDSLVVVDTYNWTGIVDGESPWSAGFPHPSPFLLIAYWDNCNVSAYDYQFTFLGKNIAFTGQNKLSNFPDVIQWVEGEVETVYEKMAELSAKIDALAKLITPPASSSGSKTTSTPSSKDDDEESDETKEDIDELEEGYDGLVAGLVIVSIVLCLIIIFLTLAIGVVYWTLSKRIKRFYENSS